MKDRYDTYKANMDDVWRARFTWGGIYGDSPKYSITIPQFAMETGALDKLTKHKDAKKLRTVLEDVANQYASWCIFKGVYTMEECADLKRFFMGALGEYFFASLLDSVKCFLVDDRYTDAKRRVDFNYVAPRLASDKDFGVDLTGVLTIGKKTTSCGIQVKFWNPELDTPMTNAIASAAYTDSVVNRFIKPYDKDNVVICWLGDTTHVTSYLKANKPLYDHVVFIDGDVLDRGINRSQHEFWDSFYTSLSNIKGLA